MGDATRPLAGQSLIEVALRKSRGERIIFLREALDPPLTRDDLADKGPWHTNTVGGWERDESEPTPQNYMRLAEILGVPLEVLMVD